MYFCYGSKPDKTNFRRKGVNKVTEYVLMSKYTQVLDKSVNFKPANRGLSSRDK